MWGGVNKIYILLIIGLLFTCQASFAQYVRDSVNVHFRQGYSNIDTSIGDNRIALDRIADSLTTSYADSLYRLRHVTIIGGASPEGSIVLNKRLSEKRANNLFNYLARYGSLSSSDMTFVYLGRDWQGLLQLVRNDAAVPYRDEVIAMLEDIVARSAEGENIADNNIGRLSTLRGGEPYRYMYRVLFPELRASRMILNYERVWVPTRTPAVATEMAIAAPKATLPRVEIAQPSSAPQSAKKPFYMAIKNNLLYDALLVPNIGVEFYLGRDISLAANWYYSWWDNNTKWYWRTTGGDIALRKWFGKQAKAKPLSGHHLGLYAQALTYDIMWGKHGYMGGEPGGNLFDRAHAAAGIEYGYSLPVAKRFNVDFTLGAGYMWGKYYEYTYVDDCHVWQATKNRKWIGPTKAEISLVWLIGRGNVNAKKGGRR